MSHWLIPGPVHFLALLALLTVRAWWPRPASLPGPGGRHRRAGPWVRWGLLGALAAAWIAATPGFAELALRRLEGPPVDVAAAAAAQSPDPSTVIVVLASGEMSGRGHPVQVRLDIHGTERVRAAVALWQRTGGLLVMAGGPGAGPSDSLAGAMARLAGDLGVPSSSMRLATGSTNTREDLESVLTAVGATSLGGSPWLVTSALHMPRALATAQAIGLTPRPFPCDYRRIRAMRVRTWLPDPQAARRLQPVLHELGGLAVYRWRGWVE